MADRSDRWAVGLAVLGLVVLVGGIVTLGYVELRSSPCTDPYDSCIPQYMLEQAVLASRGWMAIGAGVTLVLLGWLVRQSRGAPPESPA